MTVITFLFVYELLNWKRLELGFNLKFKTLTSIRNLILNRYIPASLWDRYRRLVHVSPSVTDMDYVHTIRGELNAIFPMKKKMIWTI